MRPPDELIMVDWARDFINYFEHWRDTMCQPSYRFTHRPEGWKIEFELGDFHTHVGYYPTEPDAIRALNMALGEAGLIRYRFNGGAL